MIVISVNCQVCNKHYNKQIMMDNKSEIIELIHQKNIIILFQYHLLFSLLKYRLVLHQIAEGFNAVIFSKLYPHILTTFCQTIQ